MDRSERWWESRSTRRAAPRARLARAAAALALLLSGAARADSSIACAGGIVSVGDTKLDLLAKCGAPALSEARRAEVGELVQVDGGVAATRIAARSTVETWTYDFGPGRFIQIVTLERGKVKAIERGGYGYLREPPRDRPRIPVSRCDGDAIHVGDASYDVLARCGEPAVKVRGEEERLTAAAARGDSTAFATVTAAVEAWTYNFGPNRFLLTVTIVDGKVVEVERGGYGYREQ